MNPYQINPRLIQSVEQANSALKLFSNELTVQTANIAQADEMRNASMDALVQANPGIAQSLDSLSYAAEIVGQTTRAKADTLAMQAQFYSALPYAIKQQMAK